MASASLRATSTPRRLSVQRQKWSGRLLGNWIYPSQERPHNASTSSVARYGALFALQIRRAGQLKNRSDVERGDGGPFEPLSTARERLHRPPEALEEVSFTRPIGVVPDR